MFERKRGLVSIALALQRLTGPVVSRPGTYAKASPQCVEEYLAARW